MNTFKVFFLVTNDVLDHHFQSNVVDQSGHWPINIQTYFVCANYKKSPPMRSVECLHPIELQYVSCVH